MEKCLVNLVGNLLELVIINLFLSATCQRKYSPLRHCLLSIPILLLMFTGTNLFIGKSVLIIIASFLSIFAMTLLYKSKWHMRVLNAILIYLIVALTEVLMMVMFNLNGIDTQLSQDSPLFFLLGTVISKVFAIIITCLLRLFIKKKQYAIKNVLLVSPLPLSSAITLAVFFPLYYNATESITFIGIFASSALLIFANLSVFYFLEKQDDYISSKAKLMFAEKQLDIQKEHYKELYNHLKETRVFRHDTKNMMLSLMGLIKENQTEKALQVIQNNLDVLDLQSGYAVQSGNPVIDAIVHSKWVDAENRGISLETSVKLAHPIIADEIDIGILLGNILDNAIEATGKVPPEQRIPIRLNIVSTQGHISVHAVNCTAEDIDTKNLKTTKKEAVNHGYGTKIIKTLAEKYNGFADFECKNNIFTTSVNITNEKIYKN